MVQSVKPLLNAQAIAQLPRCRAIIRVGIGYDSVDVGEATRRGILVCNVPKYCVEEVADHSMALLLSLARHLNRLDHTLHARRWDRTGQKPARRLSCQTLGIIGLGKIGRALASGRMVSLCKASASYWQLTKQKRLIKTQTSLR